MDPTYEVVFYGTDAAGDEALEVMQRVRALLKLSERQIINLFDQTDGVTLLTTSKKAKAERLVKALLRAGASCNLRDSHTQKGAWEAWRLEEKAAGEYTIPGTTRTHVVAETLRDWLKRYRKGGCRPI